MLGDFGEVLVMDWGIALPTADFRKHGSITQSLAMGGTPAYMAPEMATGPVERITFRSDVYLLGAILFEIVSGTPPHNGKDVMQCVLAAARNEIVTTQVSGELLEIALRAMSTRPEDRFATVQDFQNALHDYQSHHESILLGERADGLMVEASQSGEYETYSRALFAYQEAAALWAGNEHAITGINNAKLAYAQRALTKGDFDLGLSLLVANDPRHTPLRQALLRAQRERDARQMRLKSVRRLVVLLTLFILVSGGYALFFIYEQWQDTEIARDKASQLNEELKAKQNELTSQIARVRAAEGVARENTRLALEQKTVADAERQRADELRLEAIQSRQRAEEQAYFSEVGLAGEKLSGTAYGVAREILNGLAKSPAKSKLRHWEWAHYAYVSNGGRTNDPDRPVVRVPCDQQIEALAATADQRWFIVGLSKGELQIRSGSDLSIVHSWRGGQSIRDLDISTDGQTLITTGLSESGASVVTQWNWQDQSQPPVRVSDLYTGDLPITAVSVQQNTSSPLIAWGNERGVITVRNPATQQSRECLGHFARVNDLTFTPSGQHLLSASEDGTVRAWNVSEAREVQRFRGHGTAVRSVAVSSDGSMIASGGSGSRILVWQFDPSLTNEALVEEVRRRVSGQPILDALYVTCTGHSGPILCLKFNAQNDLISGSQDQTLRLWDLRQIKFPTGNEMRDSQVATTVSPPSRVLRGHGGWVTGCSVSDDSRFVYSTSYDQEFRRWDTGRIGEYLTLRGPDQPIVAAEFVPNSPFIATALNDGSLALRNQQTGETVNLLQEGHQFLAAKGKFLAAGQRLATLAGDNTLRVWDTESGAELRSIPRVGRQAIADFSSDGERVLVTGDARTPAIYQLSDGQKVVDFDLFLSERKKFIQDHPDRSAVDYEAQLPVPTAVAMSPDQQLALIGTSTGLCQIWEVGSGTLKQQTQIHNESIICADIVHPPGTQDNSNWVAITASVDGSIAWFDLATGQELSQPRLKHPFPLSSAYVSDDGSQMITVAYFGKDGSRLTCWDLNAARLVNTRDLPHLQVLDVEFAALVHRALC